MKKLNLLISILLIITFFIGIVLLINENSIVTKNNNSNYQVVESSRNPKLSANSKNWTFMIYLDADCNLESVGIEDINEMEMEGSDDNISIVVQIDRIPGYDLSNGDWTGTKRFYITKDFDTAIISSNVVQDLGEVNMGSAATLQNFIQWAKSDYPAENYALILWDHGSGIMDGNAPGGVCWDDSDGGDYLTLSEISSVLSSTPVDLLGFDACLMGAVEVHYKLKDSVDVIVGSEDNEPNEGYPYNDILNYLILNPNATPEQLGEQIVIKYNNSYSEGYDVTQAAVNIFTPEFNNSLNNFINDLNKVGNEHVLTARSASLEFSSEYYIDLYDFANEIRGFVGISAKYLMDNITKIVIKEAHSISQADAHGLSIYFPKYLSGYSSNYENTQFAHDYNWDEFLIKYYTGKLPGENDDEYEENDDFEEAKLLSPGQYNLFCNASDLDFFNVSVTAGEKLDVKIIFDHDQGNLTLYLFNSSLIEVNRSDSITDNESLSYIAPFTGYYTILISQEPFPSHIEYQPYSLILNGCNEIKPKEYYVSSNNDNEDNESDSNDLQINDFLILILIITILAIVIALSIIVLFLK